MYILKNNCSSVSLCSMSWLIFRMCTDIIPYLIGLINCRLEETCYHLHFNVIITILVTTLILRRVTETMSLGW